MRSTMALTFFVWALSLLSIAHGFVAPSRSATGWSHPSFRVKHPDSRKVPGWNHPGVEEKRYVNKDCQNVAGRNRHGLDTKRYVNNDDTNPLVAAKTLKQHGQQACVAFGHGVSDVVVRHWHHRSRQKIVGLIATVLTLQGLRSQAATQLFICFKQHTVVACFVDVLYIFQIGIWNGVCAVAKPFGGSSLARSLAGSSIVEELWYRFFLLRVCKLFWTRYMSEQNASIQRHRIWTPWSVFTSIVFAFGHLDFWAVDSFELLLQTAGGNMHVATNAKHVVEAFFGSMYLLNPMFERFGFFASVGAHFAWNSFFYVTPLRDFLLAAHFFHRVLGDYTLPWKTSPLQAWAERLYFFYYFLFH